MDPDDVTQFWVDLLACTPNLVELQVPETSGILPVAYDDRLGDAILDLHGLQVLVLYVALLAGRWDRVAEAMRHCESAAWMCRDAAHCRARAE